MVFGRDDQPGSRVRRWMEVGCSTEVIVYYTGDDLIG